MHNLSCFPKTKIKNSKYISIPLRDTSLSECTQLHASTQVHEHIAIAILRILLYHLL